MLFLLYEHFLIIFVFISSKSAQWFRRYDSLKFYSFFFLNLQPMSPGSAIATGLNSYQCLFLISLVFSQSHWHFSCIIQSLTDLLKVTGHFGVTFKQSYDHFNICCSCDRVSIMSKLVFLIYLVIVYIPC